jgi:hypothetical protein
MRKPLEGLAIFAMAAMLVACAPSGRSEDGGSPGAASASATPSASPSASSSASLAAAAGSLDGVWVVRLGAHESACILVQDRLLHVTSGSATIRPHIAGLEGGDPELSGPATLNGDAVVVHVENSAPTKDYIDFSGALGADGTVSGTATVGGIHPGLTNGYVCEFAATLVRVAGASTAQCSVEVVQAALNSATGRTQFVTLKNQATQLVCAGDWAFAFAQVDLDGGSPSLESDLLHANSGAWEVLDFTAECVSRQAPEEVLFACP